MSDTSDAQVRQAEDLKVAAKFADEQARRLRKEKDEHAKALIAASRLRASQTSKEK